MRSIVPLFVAILVVGNDNGIITAFQPTTSRTAVGRGVIRPLAQTCVVVTHQQLHRTSRRTVACRVASLRDDDSTTTTTALVGPSSSAPPTRSPALGLGILLTVPICWGTYNPVVKMMYGLEHPIPGVVFSAAYFWVGATTLWILEAFLANNNNRVDSTPSTTTTSRSLQWQCGFELGTYLFLGALLQVWGLRTVPADRASFLIQLTTVIVPFLEFFLAGKSLSRTTLTASLLAFTGVVLIEMEAGAAAAENVFVSAASSTTTTSSATAMIAPDDAFLLLAAVFYSLHVVRLGHYAPRLQPLQLAKSKATAQGILSTTFLLSLLWLFPGENNPMAAEVQTFFQQQQQQPGSEGFSPPPLLAIASILWMGWSTGAWAIFAQSWGQKLVSSPTTANMVYSLQPLFTAFFAYLLLSEEISGVLGGSCILAAVYMVGTQQEEEEQQVDDDEDDGEPAANASGRIHNNNNNTKTFPLLSRDDPC